MSALIGKEIEEVVASQPAKAVTGSSERQQVEFRDELGTCVRCEGEFMRPVGYVGDRRLPGMGVLCPGCAAKEARLITDIMDTYGTGTTGPMLARRENAQLWVLDDLGTERATDNALRIIFDLVNAREGHPTVITSNHEPGELGRRFKDSDEWQRLSSRLASQNFRAVRVEGSDRRFAA